MFENVDNRLQQFLRKHRKWIFFCIALLATIVTIIYVVELPREHRITSGRWDVVIDTFYTRGVSLEFFIFHANGSFEQHTFYDQFMSQLLGRVMSFTIGYWSIDDQSITLTYDFNNIIYGGTWRYRIEGNTLIMLRGNITHVLEQGIENFRR